MTQMRSTKKGKTYTTTWWQKKKAAGIFQISCFDDEVNLLIANLKVTIFNCWVLIYTIHNDIMIGSHHHVCSVSQSFIQVLVQSNPIENFDFRKQSPSKGFST